MTLVFDELYPFMIPSKNLIFLIFCIGYNGCKSVFVAASFSVDVYKRKKLYLCFLILKYEPWLMMIHIFIVIEFVIGGFFTTLILLSRLRK